MSCDFILKSYNLLFAFSFCFFKMECLNALLILGGGNMEEKSIEELRSEIIKLNEEKTKLSEQIDFYKEMESKYKDYQETSSKEIQRLKEKNYELFERIGMVDNIEVQKAEPVRSEEELKEDALNKLLSDFIK